jgi:hypothetical protein
MKTQKNRSQKSETRSQRAGLAGAIRNLLKGTVRPVAYSTLYSSLNISPGEEKKRVITAIGDFVKRGEISRTPSGLLKYNHAWKRGSKSPVKNKILKAMYVSSGFAGTDIKRLTAADNNYICELIKELCEAGHLVRVGRRTCAHGHGAEWLYNVADRVKFRLEVME